MDKKVKYSKVCSAQELQDLVGSTITSVQSYETVEDEGLYIDSEDEDGNLLSFLISGNGSWHFYNCRKRNITVEQIGQLAMLTECSDIDSVHFNRDTPFIEIVIKPIGTNAADRVLTVLRGIFPKLEVSKDKWEFKGEFQPMYQCDDPSYNFMITVAVMPNDLGNVQ